MNLFWYQKNKLLVFKKVDWKDMGDDKEIFVACLNSLTVDQSSILSMSKISKIDYLTEKWKKSL